MRPEPTPRRSASPDLAGYALVILSALCYSSLGIYGKVLFREGMDLVSILATRFVLASASLWALLAVSPRLRTEAARARGRWRALFLWGLLGLSGQAALFFGALRFISASLAEILLYTCPAFLAIVLWVRTRRRPTLPTLTAIGLALLGTWLVAAPASGGAPAGGGAPPPAGVLLGLAAGLWFSLFVLGLERASAGVDPIVTTNFVVTGSAVAYVAIATFAGGFRPPPGPAAWAALLGMVLTATLCGFAFFVVGLRRTGAQVASVLSTFEPVGTLLLAALFLGERLGGGQWLGALLVLAAAFVLAARPGPDHETAAGVQH